MLVHLKIGEIDPSASEKLDEIPAVLEREALLCYVGTHMSADGEVTVKPEHLSRLAKNHNSFVSKLKRLANNAVPVSKMPPVQLDHSTSARDTVGRVSGDIWVDRITDEAGEEIDGLFGKLRIVGRENVEKVLDGRWQHLSVGADFDAGYLQEVTITPFPAAKASSFLSRVRRQATDHPASESTETTTQVSQLSAGGEPSMWKDREAMKRYLTGHKQLSDDDAEKRLKQCENDEEEMKKLSAEYEEHEKLSAEKDDKDDDEKKEKHLARMSAAREQIAKLSTTFIAETKTARLAARVASINTRLARLRAAAKITPAEIKKLDVTDLAAKQDDYIDGILRTYESREPVIIAGQLGSLKATSLHSLHKQVQMSQLEYETRQNMSMLRGKAPAQKLAGLSDEKVQIHIDTDPHVDMGSWQSDYDSLCRMMDEGKTNEVKEHLKRILSRMGASSAESPEDNEKHLSTLTDSLAKLEAGYKNLQQIAEELVVE